LLVRIIVPAILIFAALVPATSNAQEDRMHDDWASLEHYRKANAALPPPARGEKRVVFMGDSITEAWGRRFDTEFPGKPYVNRGISGQTTPQMLVRFRPDVIDLHPAAVVILGGINDIAGNTGPETPEMIENNLMSMIDLARANGIAVVLCSVLPASRFSWRPDLAPAQDIVRLNTWMHNYATKHRLTWVDFHTAMADEHEGLPAALSADGVHPNEAGYGVMAPLIEQGIAKALR
jgi:lysophospholipase L1-like esterase